MLKVNRFDYSSIKDKHFDTSTGFLKIPGYATKTGIFTYRKADGSVFKEYRPDEEVFKKESMDSLAAKPVTNSHPKSFVTLDSARDVMVGFTGDNIIKEADRIRTTVTINDKKAVAAVEKGKQELSCGYTCDLDYTPGEFNGKKYDAIQRNIRYNHLAIVQKGRAGSSARLRLDTDDAVQVQDALNGISYNDLREQLNLLT